MRAAHTCRPMAEGTQQPRQRVSLLRLFAAALAGALGAFGVPVAGAHAGPAAQGAQPPPASAADTAPR
jgi:hypothetical protein